jgi:hypothetical protein
LNYIGHQKIDKDIEQEINKMKSCFLEFFEGNSLEEYEIEQGEDFLFVKASLPTSYSLYQSFGKAYRINSDSNLISVNIPARNDKDFWSSTEKRDVAFYVIFNGEEALNLARLLKKIDEANLSKIFLKFRFILVWIILFFLLKNLTVYLKVIINIMREKRLKKQNDRIREENFAKAIKIEKEIKELQEQLVNEIKNNKEVINTFINQYISPNELEKYKARLQVVPQSVTKELDINEQYEFYNNSINKLEKYKNLINKEDEGLLGDCFKLLYNIFTLPRQTYFLYQVLHQFLLEKDINAPETIENLSQKISELENSINQIIEEYQKDLNLISLGLEGERRVQQELKMYDDYFQIINNIRIEYEGMSVEIDNIIICPQGVYLLEVKNLGQSGKYSLKISKDGRWTKLIGNEEKPMDNITSQQNRHVAVIQRLINKKMKEIFGEEIPYIFTTPIIVIANENVDIFNESDLPIYRISNIYRYIINNSNTVLSKEYISEIIKVLESHRVSLRKYSVCDYLASIDLQYSQIVAQQKMLILTKNIAKDYTDYFMNEYAEKLEKINALTAELSSYLLKNTIRNFNNKTYSKPPEIKYMGMEEFTSK